MCLTGTIWEDERGIRRETGPIRAKAVIYEKEDPVLTRIFCDCSSNRQIQGPPSAQSNARRRAGSRGLPPVVIRGGQESTVCSAGGSGHPWVLSPVRCPAAHAICGSAGQNVDSGLFITLSRARSLFLCLPLPLDSCCNFLSPPLGIHRLLLSFLSFEMLEHGAEVTEVKLCNLRSVALEKQVQIRVWNVHTWYSPEDFSSVWTRNPRRSSY